VRAIAFAGLVDDICGAGAISSAVASARELPGTVPLLEAIFTSVSEERMLHAPMAYRVYTGTQQN